MSESGVPFHNLTAVFAMGTFPVPQGNPLPFRDPLGNGFYQFGDKRQCTFGGYFPEGTEAAYLATFAAAAAAWGRTETVAVVEYPAAPEVPWWIVLASGETFRTIGCYQQRKTLFVTNLANPYNPVQLALEECGKTWFAVKASSKKEAKANARSVANLKYCSRIQKGLLPVDRALRHEVS